MTDTYAERLSRSHGLQGRSDFIDHYESAEEWENRAE